MKSEIINDSKQNVYFSPTSLIVEFSGYYSSTEFFKVIGVVEVLKNNVDIFEASTAALSTMKLVNLLLLSLQTLQSRSRIHRYIFITSKFKVEAGCS